MPLSSIYDMVNSRLRITGFSTGLDTDAIVKQLLSVEYLKINRVKQEKQLLEWKRDGYREIINLIRGFKDTYFDVLKPSTNLMSPSAFTVFEASSAAENVVKVTASGGAAPGTFDVTVTALAKKAVKTSSGPVSSGYSGLTGANPVDMSRMKQGKEFVVTLDGVSKTIVLDKDYTSYPVSAFASNSADPALATDGLQKLLNDAFGAGKIIVTGDDLTGKITFTVSTPSSVLSISDSKNTYLGTLGLSDGQSNRISGGSISDFSGGKFYLAVDSGSPVEINVEAASDRDSLVANINAALDSAGLGDTLKAVADPGSDDKIVFVTLDTSRTVTFTSGDSDDLLGKIGLASGKKINALQGTINYGQSDLNRDFYITVNGVDYHIELAYDYTSDTGTDPGGRTLAQAIQEQLYSQGVTGVEVNIAGGKISFLNSGGHIIAIRRGDDGLKEELGFSNSQGGSRIDINRSLGSISLETGFVFDTEGNLSFTINGVEFTANESESLKSLLDRINASSAQVTFRYDSLNDRFILESKDTGESAVVSTRDLSGNFFAALKIDSSSDARGENARLTIGATPVERPTNTFTIDGITYDIKGVGTSTVTISPNPDELVEKIKGFVAKYNEVIDFINKKLSEERFRNYPPLTDEQKREMSERDIELWEEKAKSGLLRNDSILQKMLISMRRALYDDVKDVGLKLYDIGITTSSLYQEKGKLVVDEGKLRQAIIDNPDEVAMLFTRQSQYSYEDTGNRAQRYYEGGIAQRLHDIIQDHIRITRDQTGTKGLLIEKSGIEGDITQYNSLISREILDKERQINEMLVELYEKEEMYYARFAAMERVISQMNSQAAWLAQQFNQGMYM